MAICPSMMKLMTPYLDGELDVKESLRVDAHLQECEECRETFLADKEFLTIVHDAGVVAPAPEFTTRCLRAALDREVRESAPRRRSRLPWIAAVIGLFTSSVLLLTLWGSRHPPSDLVQLAVDEHREFLNDPDGLEIRSGNGAMVSSWFQSRLHFDIDIPKNTPSDFHLAGGRIVTDGDLRAAYLAFRTGDETVSLLVSPPQEIHFADREVISFRNMLFHPSDVDNYHALEWSDSRHTYVLVASSPRLVSEACRVCHSSNRDRHVIDGFANGI
jgi:anti-sigma factor RsiW